MSEVENLRVHLHIRDALDLWDENASRIVDADTSPAGEDEMDRHAYEWEHSGVTGRAELSGENGSTLIRFILEGEGAERDLNRILDRLPEVLDEVESMEGVSFVVEPKPDASSDEHMSRDQPL